MEMICDEISKKIIEATKKLAHKKSAGKITVRDVLTNLDITNRVFYNRFHNIEEVMDILRAESIDKVRESLSFEWDEKTDFGEYIEKIAASTLVFSYESREYMSQYIFEADSNASENFDWWNKKIADLIDLGKKSSYFPESLETMTISYSIWCFIRGFNADAIARKLPMDEALSLFKYGFNSLICGMRNV